MSEQNESNWKNSEAAVFTEYAGRLAALAQKHLSAKLHSRVDGEDIAQSVFRTFIRRRRAGEFAIDSSTELWKLLARITVRKAQAKGRHHTAGMRDVGNEKNLEQTSMAADAPTPEDAVLVDDEIQRILDGLPEQYATILGMLLEGESRANVAQHLNLSRMTIHRVIKVLKKRLEDS